MGGKQKSGEVSSRRSVFSPARLRSIHLKGRSPRDDLRRMACILIIENEILFRQVVAVALTQDGHSVFEAGDGRTAAAILKALRVDLILTDLVMPNGDGIEVITNARLDRNPIPIIAMTGWHSQSELFSSIAKKLGAQRVLRKPFTMAALLNAVGEVSSHALVATPA